MTRVVECSKCKRFFEVDNRSGVYKCSHCETPKEVYVYNEVLECEDINTIVDLSKDLTRVFKKHNLEFGKVTTMSIAENLYLNELGVIEDINL